MPLALHPAHGFSRKESLPQLVAGCLWAGRAAWVYKPRCSFLQAWGSAAVERLLSVYQERDPVLICLVIEMRVELCGFTLTAGSLFVLCSKFIRPVTWQRG